MAVYFIRDTCAENVAVTVPWRFTDDTDDGDGNGAMYQQADITSMKYDAYDLRDTDTALADDTALVVASTVYDTAQSWGVDSTGYNCKATFPGTLFATAGSVIRIEVYAILAADSTKVLAALIEITVQELFGG